MQYGSNSLETTYILFKLPYTWRRIGHFLVNLPYIAHNYLTQLLNSTIRDLRETIESGPLCITDLFQNKSVAYL